MTDAALIAAVAEREPVESLELARLFGIVEMGPLHATLKRLEKARRLRHSEVGWTTTTPRCSATTAKGEPCRSAATKGDTCARHVPGVVVDLATYRRRFGGGRAA